MNRDDRPELLTIWDEARRHIENGDYDRAIETYQYIIIRYADNDAAVEHANAYLGDIFLTSRKLVLAEDHLKKAIGYAPDKPHYHYLLGFTYSVMQKWRKAQSALQVAVQLKPNDGEYVGALGWAVFNAGDSAEGLAQLHRAAELAPDRTNIRMDLAAAFLTMGNLDRAEECGRIVLTIDPDYTLAHDLLQNVNRLRKMLGQPNS